MKKKCIKNIVALIVVLATILSSYSIFADTQSTINTTYLNDNGALENNILDNKKVSINIEDSLTTIGKKVKKDILLQNINDSIVLINEGVIPGNNTLNSIDISSGLKEAYNERKPVAFIGMEGVMESYEKCKLLGTTNGVEITAEDLSDLIGMCFYKDEYNRDIIYVFLDDSTISYDEKIAKMILKIGDKCGNVETLKNDNVLQDLDLIEDSGRNVIVEIDRENDSGTLTYVAIGNRVDSNNKDMTLWVVDNKTSVTPKYCNEWGIPRKTKRIITNIKTYNQNDEDIIDVEPSNYVDDEQITVGLTVGAEGLEANLSRTFIYRAMNCSLSGDMKYNNVTWTTDIDIYAEIADKLVKQESVVLFTNKYRGAQLSVTASALFVKAGLEESTLSINDFHFGFPDLVVYGCGN